MKRYRANTQLKLLLYVLFIGAIAYIIQDKYNVFKFETTKSIQDESPKEQTIYIEKGTGEKIPIKVEVADTDSERAEGLMNRESLEEHKGMLFIFDEDSINGFWMKDTLIPLDMIFIDSDKKIVKILENIQPCEDSPCPVYNPEVVYRYVVEVNAGWVARNTVEIGDTLDLTELTSAS